MPVMLVSAQEADTMHQQAIELSEQLVLTGQQTLEVEKIVKMAQNPYSETDLPDADERGRARIAPQSSPRSSVLVRVPFP